MLERDRIARLIHQSLKSNGKSKEVGQRLSGERTMAKKLGCSRTTIRAALSQLESHGLLHRVHGKGTFVMNMPGDKPFPVFESQQLTQVGLVIINNEELIDAYAMLAMGMREVLGHQSFQINFWTLNTREGLSSNNFPSLLEMSDLFVVSGDFSHSELMWLCKKRKPIIVVGQAADEVLKMAKDQHLQIYPDYRSAYMRGTEYLWSLGYRRPAILVGSQHRAHQERYEGFCAALTNVGEDPANFKRYEIAQDATTGAIDLAERRAAVEQVLEDRDQFDSLITGSSIEVLGAARRKGVSIPGDFALIAETYGHHRFMEEFGITELRADHRVMGNLAAQRIMKIKQDSHDLVHQRQLSLPIDLIVRESCPIVKKEVKLEGSVHPSPPEASQQGRYAFDA